MIKAAGLFPGKIDTVEFLAYIALSKGKVYIDTSITSYQHVTSITINYLMINYYIIIHNNNDLFVHLLAKSNGICNANVQFVIYFDVQLLSLSFGTRSSVLAPSRSH